MSALSPSKDLGVKIGDSGPVSILQLFTSRAKPWCLLCGCVHSREENFPRDGEKIADGFPLRQSAGGGVRVS